MARTFERQVIELHVRVALLNHLNQSTVLRLPPWNESVRGWGYGAGKSICATKPLQIHDKAIKSTRIAFPVPTFASGPRILRV